MAIKETITIIADTEEANKNIKTLFDNLSKEEKDAIKENKKFSDSIEDVSDSLVDGSKAANRYSESIKSTQKELVDNISISAGYKDAIKDLNLRFKEGSISQDEYSSSLVRLKRDEKETAVETERLRKTLGVLKRNQKDLATGSKGASKGLKTLSKESKGVSQSFKGIGLAIKAAGIGLIIAGFTILKDLFSKNQKVMDFFSSGFEALSIAFNDFFNFINENAGSFLSLFENPLESIKNFGTLIQENIIERFNSALDVLGHLSTAFKKVFEGDFKGALESVKDAGKEYVDVLTGVNNTVDRVSDGVSELVDKGSEYLNQTIKQAKANVQLKNTAELATAQQGRLVEQYDRLAEKQRQLRDDESISVNDRIIANEALGVVLNNQEESMLRLADLQIASAQANKNTNNTIENQVALIDALANKEAVLAQVEGFRSEQLVNRIALIKEKNELEQTGYDAEKERQIAQKEFDETQAETEKEKLIIQKERLDLENEIIINDIENKRALYEEGTQLRVEAEENYKTEKQRIDNEITANEILSIKEREKSEIALADAKINIAQSVLSSVMSLSKSGSDFAKGIAVAQATINTYAGINKALAETTDFTTTQSLRFANAAAVGLAGFANVASILSTNTSGGSGGGSVSASSSGGGGISAPSFNLVEGTGTNQIAESINSQNQAPVQAFVVSNKITTAQEFDNNVEVNASL